MLNKLFRAIGLGKDDVRAKFSRIYRENVFGSSESRSGGGSTLEQTKVLRRDLPALLRDLGVRTLMDAPCGDLNWIKLTPLELDRYIGIDIVEKLVESNRQAFASQAREFLCLDIIADELPRADAVLCRDCLVHLNFKQALDAVLNFKRSGATYLLTTTFTDRDRNVDLGKGDIWRTLNLERPPFNFPKPLRLLNEECTEGEGKYSDKCLGIWRLDDLKIQAMGTGQR